MQFNMAGKRMILDRGRYKPYANRGSLSMAKKSQADSEYEKQLMEQAKQAQIARERRTLATTQFVPPVASK
jgi:hypothetical protein